MLSLKAGKPFLKHDILENKQEADPTISSMPSI
jgi:hypothetical protein